MPMHSSEWLLTIYIHEYMIIWRWLALHDDDEELCEVEDADAQYGMVAHGAMHIYIHDHIASARST
jgi:hypothetical protein